ncbi:RagB/SusD family nutrient uptake outer membrane protein [Flavobacterium sp. RSP15]|uniref:RagB/SusD family nutrient uptake outer membrane protein n=1 Tax=Flavobacterium sp. RSP15 TaxID=2497485 RepID=UPI000F843F0F|nr:RagB/SusD family nutrient uptake outer membrane protein [Flavobacterium sp. RSP15]RTY86229.1 RagB/SusD family nutrient uptake outer membrane protein [Flavobacterium sp. RSP15]
MKTRFKILALVFLISITACELDEKPTGFYSEDNFYKTEADADAAVNYAYDALTFLEYSRSIFYLGDLTTEESYTKSDEAIDNQNLDKWNVSTFINNGMLTNFFKYTYIAINRANAVLKNVPAGTYDQSIKDKFMGEAYFLRAWNYYNLVKAFGIVPIHTSLVETLDQTSAPMAQNLDEIYDLIISDCTQAIELLEINQALGRADKAAAQALLAKVYLTIASSKEHNVSLYTQMNKDVSTMYQLAAKNAAEVLKNQNVYGFETNLIEIYNVNKPQGRENIFLLSMDRSGSIEGDYSKISKLFIPYIDGATIYLKNPDNTLTKSHDGWSVFQTNIEFYNSFDNLDKRKTELFVTKTYNEQGILTAEFPGTIPFPFSRKYIDPDFIGDKTSTKPFLIRFSEVALIYAEAAGPTNDAYSYLNYIRNRAGLGDAAPGLSINDFRIAILKERSWELALEGNRLYDLRRFNKVVEIVPNAAGLSDDQVNFYPIPQTEINLNPGL